MRGKQGTLAISPILACQYCGTRYAVKGFRSCLLAKYRYCSMGCATLARTADPAIREKIKAAAKLRSADPEFRAMIGKVARRTWTGRRHSQSTIDLIRQKAEVRFRDPAVREKQGMNGIATQFKKGPRLDKRLPPEEKLIRRRISDFAHKLVKRCLVEKREHTYAALGYGPVELRAHIESLFLPGMSWQNYGIRGWHIDHVRPICTFPQGAPLSVINALSNLRPLWWLDNMKRSRKMPV